MKTKISPIPRPALKWFGLIILAWLLNRWLTRYFDRNAGSRQEEINREMQRFDTPNPALN